MPLELMACPKCRGQASEYEKDKWRCMKCGQRFVYTSPLATPAQFSPTQAPPVQQTTVIIRETAANPVFAVAQTQFGPKQRRRRLGAFTVLLWLTGVGLMGWALADRQRDSLGPMGVFVCAIAVVFSLIWGVKRLFRRSPAP